MTWPERDRQLIENYFCDFSTALEVHLRSLKNQLSNYWGGIDKSRFSMLVYLCQHGMVVRVVPKWLGSKVIVRQDVSFEELMVSRWKGHDFGAGKQVYASAVCKHLAGDAMMQLGIAQNGDALTISPPNHGGSFIAIAPLLYKGLSREQASQLQDAKTERDRATLSLPSPKPPWAISIIAARTGGEAIDGLDAEPFIAAKGIADIIARLAGQTDQDPSLRYRTVREELENAVSKSNQENEPSLQKVVEEYPWILVYESDFLHVEPEATLKYIERQICDAEETVSVEKSIRPDFLYELFDDRFLVVEIEAATKRLLKKTEETAYQLPTAQTVAAMFQIQNYKQICSGRFGSQICQHLKKPDHWSFEYLLVVGSERQPNFDRRSWALLRDHLGSQSITVRDWGYYINRLRRLESAASVN